MYVGEVVVAPGHQLFHDEEDDDRGDIVLDRQYIMSVLDVQEAPEDGKHRVDDGQAAIKGQLCDLRRLQLPIGIPEFRYSLVICALAQCAHAIEASPLDRVIDGDGFFQMN